MNTFSTRFSLPFNTAGTHRQGIPTTIWWIPDSQQFPWRYHTHLGLFKCTNEWKWWQSITYADLYIRHTIGELEKNICRQVVVKMFLNWIVYFKESRSKVDMNYDRYKMVLNLMQIYCVCFPEQLVCCMPCVHIGPLQRDHFVSVIGHNDYLENKNKKTEIIRTSSSVWGRMMMMHKVF